MDTSWRSFRPSAHLVCRMCVTFICAVVIVLHPSAKLGGPYLFLVLTVKELVFPPSTSPSSQIEATVVNMAGALFGLSWSNLGLACASFATERYGVDSGASRAIKAIFLLILGFLTGLARSSLPRLTFASRGAGFVSAFLLTSKLDSHKWVYTNFTQLLFVCAVAGAASLVVALAAGIFVPNGGYAKDAISALGLLKDLIRLATTRTIDSTPLHNTQPFSPSLTATSTQVSTPVIAPTLENLQRTCLDASLALHSSYASSAFELRVGRVPISHIRPLLATVGRVREELAWGVVRAGVHAQGLHGEPSSEIKADDTGLSDDQLSKDELRLLATLDDPCRACADAIRGNITSLQVAVGICYGIDTSDIAQPKPRDHPRVEPKSGTTSGLRDLKEPKLSSRGLERESLLSVHEERSKLIQSREALKTQLDWVVHNMNTAHMLYTAPHHERDRTLTSPGDPPTEHDRTSHHHQLFRKSLYATSLLHISSEVLRAMTLIVSVLEHHMTNSPRVFFLRPSWIWLGISPRALVIEQTNEEPDVDSAPTRTNNGNGVEETPEGTGLSAQEIRQGLFQRRNTALLLSPAVQAKIPMPLHRNIRKWWQSFWNMPINRHSIRHAMRGIIKFPGLVLDTQWNRSGVLQFRIKLSRIVRRVQHSKHARHAVKNALGMTLLAVPGFLPAGSPGRKYFESTHGVWAIISFMYVLEPNTAMTWRVGIMRLCGTCIGATFAFVTWAICRQNPYGIVAMITAGEILLTWLVRSSTPGVGVVASVTIPPIVFTPYLGLKHTSVIDLAALRGLQISIGIIGAILVNHFLFPRHCRVMFLSGMAQVLAGLTQLYLHLSHRTLNETARTRSGMLRGAKLDLKLREMISRENVLLKQMEHEVSLMPKPTELYRASTGAVQRIADLMSGLRRIRENVPQKEAITQVLQHRQHHVSCICIVLFACEHAFRSRRPLPQMLPSPRKSFEALSREVMDALQDAPRATDIAYAVAENEVLEEMVEALENLISVTRELFGTNQWLFEGSGDFVGSFAHARSGPETPVIQTPRVSMRRLESFQ